MTDLKHYGILGMKWGVRRTDAQLGNKGIGEKSSWRSMLSKKKTSDTQHKSSISELSDTDLRAKLNRLQMEEQYSSLLKRLNEKPPSKSKEFVKKALGNFGGMLVKTISAKAAVSISNAIFDNKSKSKSKNSSSDKNTSSDKQKSSNSSDDWVFKTGKSDKQKEYKLKGRDRYLYGKSGTADGKNWLTDKD